MRQLSPLSLVVLGLVAVLARPAFAQSLLDNRWISKATPAAVQALLDRGAEVNARNESGYTPLHGAAQQNENPAVLALLLDRGAEINARNVGGETPLHRAAALNRNPAVSAVLLDRGADATLRSDAGQLPYDYAKENADLKGTAVYWLAAE